MSTSENIWQLDNVAVGRETYFLGFKLPRVPKVLITRATFAVRCFEAGRRSTHLQPIIKRPKLRVTINT